MRRLFCSIVCMLSVLYAFGQTDSFNKSLTIREAMDIVAYRRNHPFMDDEEFDGLVNAVMKRHGYIESDFLDGIGTCGFWQYIKYGHTVHNVEPLDDDHFIPDNIQKASAVAVVDCAGIETIEYDETAISVEMRVFTEGRRDELMKEMKNIGFTYKKTEYYGRDYSWQSYGVSVGEGSSRGYKYWVFNVRLNDQDYGTTKHYEFADSSRTHNLKIHVDYPVKGDPVLLRRVRTYIMEALEYDPYSGAASMGRFNGDSSDGQAVINYYGVGGVPILKKRRAAYEWEAMEEERVIKRIAENEYYITFEVTVLICASSYGYNPVIDCYGETFRKSDGKKLNIIANSQSPQFKKLLNDRFPEDMKGFLIDPEMDIPIPNTKPYLIQSGVRFVYQKSEITAPDAQYIQEDISFPVIQQFLTEDVKEVLGHSSNNNAKMDLQSAKPEFPGGNAALYEYLNRSLRYPVIAEENGIQGDVEIQFVVEKDGSITNVAVSKSVDPSLDKEAIRVVRSMPKWSPAKKNGVIVRSQQHLTIPFRLEGHIFP